MKRRNAILVCLFFFATATLADGVTLPHVERIVLENGTVLILNEKHDVPLIGLRAVVRGGVVADPDSKHGLSYILAGVLQNGAGDRDAAEFADAVAAVGGNLAASVDLESLGVSAEFLSGDAALMVELVADLLQRPALDVNEFLKIRKRSINRIKAQKGSDPSGLMAPYSNAFLFGDHPYGKALGGSEFSLAKVSHRDLLAYYRDFVGGDRLIISVSGDFDTATIAKLLEEAFAGWRAAAKPLPEVAPPTPSLSNRVYLIDKPGATQTYFRIGNVGVARDYLQRAELNLANTVFGGRFTSMLMTELRTKSGLSYGARSRLFQYRQAGALFIASFTETSTSIEAIDVALETLARLHESGLDEDMIVSARNYLMGQFPPRFETAMQLAGQFATLEEYGLTNAYIENYGDDLAAVTTESVAAVIAEVYPGPDNLVFVILGDADIIREQVSRYGPVTEVSISAPHFRPEAL